MPAIYAETISLLRYTCISIELNITCYRNLFPKESKCALIFYYISRRNL